MIDDYYEHRIRAVDEVILIPETEPDRQYYFMSKLRELISEKEQEKGGKLTYHVETFGCQMNAKDSEKLAGILSAVGYEEVETEEADMVIYNTCTVRENANTRVYGRIGFLGTLKKKNPDMHIALCGCMMQEEEAVEKIKKSYRFVDIIFGTHNIYQLAELLYRRMNGEERVISLLKDTKLIVEDLPSELKFSFKAGVNIMYGCDNFCTYCIVPYVRGRERSRRPEDIVKECEHLVSRGVREIMLLGQNVNSYGKGLEEQVSFAKLLHMVSEVPGISRIRFMTPHPKDLSDELIEEIAVNKKVCRQVHLPLQCGSSRILQKMNRRYTKEQYLELVDKIRARIPDVSLSTDIMVGFPGETDEDNEETIDVVRKARFISAFTFIYSKRNGTPAAKMDNQLSEEEQNRHFKKLLDAVNEVATEEAQRAEGQIQEVLVEEINQKNGMLTGRLDNGLLVHFDGNADLLGSLQRVLLKECKGFYYIGEVVEKN